MIWNKNENNLKKSPAIKQFYNQLNSNEYFCFQIVISKYHFLIKSTRAFWRDVSFKETFKTSLGTTNEKNALRDYQDHAKWAQDPRWTDSHWFKVGKSDHKKNKIKYIWIHEFKTVLIKKKNPLINSEIDFRGHKDTNSLTIMIDTGKGSNIYCNFLLKAIPQSNQMVDKEKFFLIKVFSLINKEWRN